MKTLTASAPRNPAASALSRAAIFVYGITSYAIGVTGLCWLIGASLGLISFGCGPIAIGSSAGAIVFDLCLIALFGVQHAVMARPAFKERWTRIIPAAMERPTFVLLAGGIMATAMWLWQPMSATVWAVESPALFVALRSLSVLGWAYLFAATFAIDHFELFGLRQVWRNLMGRERPQVPFVQRLMYRFDRHPIMTGVLVGLWATPIMRLDHLVLALGFTAYIAIGVAIEERTLVQLHGESYRQYRREVGALVPVPGRRA